MRALHLLCLMVGLAAIAAPAAAEPSSTARPARIVSLNLCIDQVLPELVTPERIAGLTTLADDPAVSAIAGRTPAIAKLRGEAEEVLALAPDLVLAGAFTAPATTALLRRAGLPVVVVPMPVDFAGVADAVRVIARAVGETRRGDAILAEMQRRLESLRQQRMHEQQPSALAYQVGGIVSAHGSFVDALFEEAALSNAAVGRIGNRTGRVELETIAGSPPDLLLMVMGSRTYRTTEADNLRHPALPRLMRRGVVDALPMPEWICPLPISVGAVERLARLARMAAGGSSGAALGRVVP